MVAGNILYSRSKIIVCVDFYWFGVQKIILLYFVCFFVVAFNLLLFSERSLLAFFSKSEYEANTVGLSVFWFWLVLVHFISIETFAGRRRRRRCLRSSICFLFFSRFIASEYMAKVVVRISYTRTNVLPTVFADSCAVKIYVLINLFDKSVICSLFVFYSILGPLVSVDTIQNTELIFVLVWFLLRFLSSIWVKFSVYFHFVLFHFFLSFLFFSI